MEIDSRKLDHFPSIFQLKLDSWNQLDENTLIELNMEEIVNLVHAKIEYRLLHNECNQGLGKIFAK